MPQIHQTYKINASASEVWKALTDPKEVEGWGGGPAEMSAEEGVEFKLWGGDIFGKNIYVEQEKLLVQEWYGSADWKEPSTVEFRIISDGETTTVELDHDGLPADEVSNFAAGWKDYYLGPLKEYVESKE